MSNRQDDYWRIRIAELETDGKSKDAAISKLLRDNEAQKARITALETGIDSVSELLKQVGYSVPELHKAPIDEQYHNDRALMRVAYMIISRVRKSLD